MYRLRKVTERNFKLSELSGSFKYRTNAGKIPIGNVLDIMRFEKGGTKGKKMVPKM